MKFIGNNNFTIIEGDLTKGFQNNLEIGSMNAIK